ncbi:Phospholipase A-2-activating protein [Seminavis robusta]|uniref:Phospholipase A-2-activating protein n=1 Tax=Seminavis robusta TaxID=568900 RepID=A0A9N8DZA0_9STRA|nr:Phospholipase A-2-activating protein [Seminavis robusta]|eukprot:Sro495_g154490.1 Phospholipase A-2-activating protein (802) ;mRNA; r:34659-37064
MQVDWELSQSLTSDGQGVRCACILPPAVADGPDSFRVVTGNQGGGLCEYGVPSGNINLIAFQHNHSVTALLSAPSSCADENHKQIYASGCKDAQIRLFNGTSHEVTSTLTGHEKPVTSLAWCPKPSGSGGFPYYLVSGSWDGTAKVWDVDRKVVVATMPNHENSVCVYGISSSPDKNKIQVATGSAGAAQNNQISGFTVRLWQIDVVTGQVQMLHSVANDHGGPIRDICGITVDGKNYLATCSNDGTVKQREEGTGKSTSTLTLIPEQSDHPPMLLSVVSIDSLLIGSAEDGHVAVWNLEEQVQPQVILHTECVWRTVAMPNGDFGTCCQDGTLRIFTRATERMAPEAERQSFVDEVAKAMQKKSSGPSDEEVAKLPKWEEQRQQMIGRSEGQVQLFQKNGRAIAAQWSMASRTWVEVGEVMGSRDSGTIDGVAYDHILPIEVDTTGGEVAKLQIGYNNGENPFVAAQRFIDAHMLPQHHLSEIADYIQQRVGNSKTTLGGGGGGPAASSSVGGGPVAGVPIASYEHLPSKTYKSFEISEKSATATFEKMKTKIQEMGKLSEEQLACVSSLMQTLAASNRYHATKLEDAELKVLLDMLEQLPPAEAFPFLDLARYAALHPDGASTARASYWDRMIQKVLNLSEDTSGLEGPAAVAIPMLSLRVFANCFKGGPGSLQAVSSSLSPILGRAEAHSKSKNKNIRLSVATVLYNICHYIHSNPSVASESIVLPTVTTINTIIEAKTYETEALYRSMVALGTLVMSNKEAKEAAKAARLSTKVEPAASPHTPQAKKLAKEIYSLLA